MTQRTLIIATVLLSILIALPLHAQTRGRTARRPAPASPPPPPAPAPEADGPGIPLPGLDQGQMEAFLDGATDFVEIETVEDGLGPVFNGRSCAECHLAPAPGGGDVRSVTRIGTMTAAGFDPLARFGGSLLEDHAIGIGDGSPHEFLPEVVPAEATIVARRKTPPLFGLGLVDATPDQAFDDLAREEGRRNPATAGRVSRVENLALGIRTVGRFGWKSQVPTLFQFAGDAYLNEMGITNPFFPNENCPRGDCDELAYNPRPDLNDLGDGVDALNHFMTYLAPTRRLPPTQEIRDGEDVFRRAGCEECHTPTLRTGPSEIAALDRVEYHPYSDFLLHDMGALGDGIPQGAATGAEMRTAPLWGLRYMKSFLHDGRALGVEDAILAHDGQALDSRNRFAALRQREKDQLLAFLGSL